MFKNPSRTMNWIMVAGELVQFPNTSHEMAGAGKKAGMISSSEELNARILIDLSE